MRYLIPSSLLRTNRQRAWQLDHGQGDVEGKGPDSRVGMVLRCFERSCHPLQVESLGAGSGEEVRLVGHKARPTLNSK